MDRNFCPTCGAEQKHQEAEICPACGVRIREGPTPKWVAAGTAAGFLALIVAVFLLGTWQGTLHGGPAQTPVPTTTVPATTGPTTIPTEPAAATGSMNENDFISAPGGDINVSRVEGNLREGGSDLYSFSLREGARLCSLTLEGPSGVDFDLYLKKGGTPNTTVYDWRSVTDGPFERIEVWGARPGSYTALVYAKSGEGPYEITQSTTYREEVTVTVTPTIPMNYWSSPFVQPADWL
jgi:hypothetical protein